MPDKIGMIQSEKNSQMDLASQIASGYGALKKGQ